MSALTPTIIEKFYELCNWAYEAWIMHRALFDDNPNADNLMRCDCGEAMARLNKITGEYVLHQIIKLHDSAMQSSSINLTVDYIVDYGGWDQQTLAILQNSRNKLRLFAENLKLARNKLLSHNDLQAILSNNPLGEFERDADCAYFDNLQEFVNIVHEKTIGGPRCFNDLVKADTHAFLSYLQKSLR